MPKKFTQKQILILAGAIVGVLGFLGLIIFNIRARTTSSQIKLSVWGTDSQQVFEKMITDYVQTGGHTGAEIHYARIDPADYEATLLAALASGSGPDVFEIDNRSLARLKGIVSPVPAGRFDIARYEQYFPMVAEQDFTDKGQIYAVPLYIDTMAMLYNRDIFDSAGIAIPPKTWNDFEAAVGRLRSLNSQGQLVRAAAAIGGSGSSVPTAADVLYLLMLQNGTQMLSEDGTSAVFASGGPSGPGQSAFNFYLQFANAASPYYTWNDGMGNAIDAFVQGKVAAIFDYQSTLDTVKSKAPFLNVGVAPMPQPDASGVSVNYARYQGLAVSKQGALNPAAWDFTLYLTTYLDGEKIYVGATGRPAAQRVVIADQITDPKISVFASQALTARSWREADDKKIDAVFNSAIRAVLSGATDSGRALNQAQQGVNDVMLNAGIKIKQSQPPPSSPLPSL